MTADRAAAFFELCLMKEAVKEEERIAILQDMAKAGEIGMFASDAGADEIVQKLAEHYNVTRIKRRE